MQYLQHECISMDGHCFGLKIANRNTKETEKPAQQELQDPGEEATAIRHGCWSGSWRLRTRTLGKFKTELDTIPISVIAEEATVFQVTHVDQLQVPGFVNDEIFLLLPPENKSE